MAIKILSKTRVVDWRSISPALCKRFPDLERIFAPIFQEVADAKVLILRLPYGVPIIQDGQFRWDILPQEHANWKREYGEIAIPLCLVTRRCIELHETAQLGGHSIPMHLLSPGEFFGLFQTFCGNMPQLNLQATAGGTSLIFLPRIGNPDVRKKWINSAYSFKKKDKKDRSSPWNSFHDHLQQDDNSSFHFGALFRDFLYQIPSRWRAEVVLFPRSLLDKIKEAAPAHLAILELVVRQMRRSYERAEEAVGILGYDDAENRGHVLALRMIANGLRPGFYPVFGMAKDEDVLPASEIHELLYGEEAPLKEAGLFYPALFRPSLKGETPLYFLKWPPGKRKQSKKLNNEDIIGRSIDRANTIETGRAKSDMFEDITGNYKEVIGSLAEQGEQLEASLPDGVAHYFIQGGIVLIRPRKELSSSLL